MPDTTRHPSAGAMSEGSHLSIGEVLALLLEEFPDVTISKIRFLESQGLIDPERTPSGYRKFFDADVELLRVILREQREHYLPLRVIKDRIDSGELDPSGDHPAPDGARDDSDDSDSDIDTHPRRSATPAATEPAADAPPDTDDEPTATRSAEPSDTGGADAQASDIGDADAQVDVEASVEPDADTPPSAAPSVGEADAVVAAVRAAGERASSTTAPEPPPPEASPPAASPQLLPGVTLSRDELAGMVGATREELSQLEDYGIVTGRDSLGERVYDEDAVEVTRIAVEFLRAGVDARHLRGWKTSADRETSVFEQLIMPLLRQRNPEGRQAARDQLQRMNELGGTLRAALMRVTLRGHLAP